MIVDQHELRVYSGDVELEPVENAGTLTADRGWSPHVQGRLTVRAPASLLTTAPGSMLRIELTQRFGDFALTRDLTDGYGGDLTSVLTTAFAGGLTSDLTALITAGSWNTPVRASTGRTLHLVVTSRTRSRDEHSLELASVEALIQDWVWYDVDVNLEGVPLTFAADTPARFLQALIRAHSAETSWVAAWAGLPIVDTSTPTVISTLEHTLQAGDGTIAALQTFLTFARQRLYSPGEERLTLTDYPYTSPYSITVEDGVNLIDWEITEDRFRQTLVRFTGTASNPAARPIYHSNPFPEINAPPEALIDSPTLPVVIKASELVSGITPAVAPFLNRVGLDESPIRLVTINDYGVMPGSAITYTLPDEDEENDTIDTITWQLGGTWQMDIWV